MKDFAIVTRLMIIEKKHVLYSVVFGFLAGIAAVSLFATSGYLVSKAALVPPLYTLTFAIAFIKFISFLRAGSRYAERYFSHKATFTILSNIRVYFYEKLEPLAPSIFQKYRSGDLLSRIVGDVETLQNYFLRVFYPPIVMLIVFLSTIFFTAFFSVYVALALVCGLLLTGFIVPALFAMRQRHVDRHVREQRGILSTDVTEFLYGFRDLKIHQQLDRQKQQLTDSSDHYLREQEREGIHALFGESVNNMISLIIAWIVLGMGAYFVVDGQLNGVFLAMLVMISLTVFETSNPMAVFPSHFENSKRASNRLFSVVDQENDVVRGEKASANVHLDTSRAPVIEMENVSFSFPDEEREALHDVTLRLATGSKTAIVGPSGSGKSTLLLLLSKVFLPNKGTLRFNHTSIEQVSQENVWEASNVVLQENHFFYGTIRDNLLIAGDELTDGEMQKALGKVTLDTFSLDDLVYEKGENLSGGEKQRLAIARAMLKAAPLWLLDEPTSSVDALTEQQLYEHLYEKAEENKDTLVLVSHRLKELEKMDQIIVMEKGRIIESGTFEELMMMEGYFYEMKKIETNLL